MVTEKEQAVIAVHQWTNGGEKVRLLKCVNKDRSSHGGFLWPEKGPVQPEIWSREKTCESGGLFGWPWGIGLGCGKNPQYDGLWVVFETHPEDVISLDGKCKAIPCPEKSRTPEVIYCGSYAGSLDLILQGQIAWIAQASGGDASATGDHGAASATGDHGDASATGDYGAASATGYNGAASATGYNGAASATGDHGAASATGDHCTVEAGKGGAAITTANNCFWKVHEDTIFVQRWEGGHICVSAKDIGAKTGDLVLFVNGAVIEIVRVEADAG